MKLPSFRAAYEFEGMKPAEFADYGAFKATETEFAAATPPDGRLRAPDDGG